MEITQLTRVIFIYLNSILDNYLKSDNMWIPYFQICPCVRVSSLVGRYFYNMYIVKSLKMLSFSVKDNSILFMFK